jgi:hypothetical protein
VFFSSPFHKEWGIGFLMMSVYLTPKCTDVSDVSSPPSGRLYVPLQKNNAKSAGVIIDAAGGDGDETRNVS